MKTKLTKHMGKLTLFALPISANGLINMVASFVAMLFVARLGSTELAAGALAVPTFITALTITVTIFYAVGILISHQRGKEKAPADIGQLVKNGLWLAVIMMLPANLLLWNVDKVLLYLGQDPALVDIARPYFHYAGLSMIPSLITTVYAQFYMGIGNPRFSLVMSTIGLIPNIILSYIFILGKMGFAPMGLAGITAAALVTQTILGVFITFYIAWGKKTRAYHIFSGKFALHLATCKQIFTLGLPIGLQFGGELAAMTVTAYLMGKFGVNALASSQMSSQYSLLLVMVTLGLSQALSLLISEAYARHQYDLVRQYIKAAMLILVIFFASIFVLFYVFKALMMGIYIHTEADKMLLPLAMNLLLIAVVTLFIDGIRNLLSGALRGLHDSKAPMQIGISCLWVVSLPVCYWTAFTLHGGPIGLRLGFLSGFVLASLWLWLRLRNKIGGMALAHEMNVNVVTTNPL